MRKIFQYVLLLAALSSISFAQLDTVRNAMGALCQGIQSLIPVASMLMLVIAAVIYAAGQMMGAETRARANVWATAALTGALIGILIVAIAPTVLETIYPAGGQFESVCVTNPPIPPGG